MAFTPEIVKGDRLYDLIVRLVRKHKPKTIVEIGSANGLGSTQAFIEGIKAEKLENECTLFCLEASRDNFTDLMDNIRECSFVKACNASSVTVEDYITDKEIDAFFDTHGYFFNVIRYYNRETVKKWREREIMMIKGLGIHNVNGLSRFVFTDAKINDNPRNIGMVLIDGSAFTGLAETIKVWGAEIIIMDDVNDIKCWEAAHFLQQQTYDMIEEDNQYRNGFAAFKRID